MAEAVEAEIVDRLHREGVESAINTGEIARHASKLGSRVFQAEKQFERRTDDVFSHEVSDLSKQPSRLAKSHSRLRERNIQDQNQKPPNP